MEILVGASARLFMSTPPKLETGDFDMVVILVEDSLEDWIASRNIDKNKLVESAWTHLNSCVFSLAALQQPMLVMAVAALELAMRCSSEIQDSGVPTGWVGRGSRWGD